MFRTHLENAKARLDPLQARSKRLGQGKEPERAASVPLFKRTEQGTIMARTSAADLAHGLKGAKFPLNKKDLLELAKKNGVADAVMKTFEELPDGEYGSVTDVEHAFHQDQGGGQGRKQENKGEATQAAQKGGHRSHGGHSRS